MNIENIAIDSISIIDEINYTFSLEDIALESSIEEFSLLAPLIVYKKANDEYIILDGMKRFNILKKRGESSIPCNIIEQGSLFDGFIKVAKIRQADNVLTLIEKAAFINILVNYFKCSAEEINSKYLKMVKLPLRKNAFELMLEVATFSNEVKLFLHRNRLPINDLFQVRLLDENNKVDLISFVESFNVSYSNLKQIVELMIEIATMKAISIEDIIHNEDISDLIENEKLPDNKKINLIKTILVKLRYPIVMAYQEEMTKKLGEVKLSNGLTVSYPKELEDDYLDIRMRIKSVSDLDDFIEQLSQINDKKYFDNILSYMQSQFNDKM